MLRSAISVTFLAGCSFSITDAAIAGDADAPTLDWWNRESTSRVRLSIRAATAVSAGFQLGFARDVDAAPCSSNRDDIRIVVNNTEIPRVIDEVGTGDEWVWFKLITPIGANATSEDYWLYCGNPTPPPAPKDPSQVFDVFDDFSAPTLGTSWVAQGTVTVTGGSVSIPPGAAIRTTTAFSPNTATDFVARATPAAMSTPYFWIGFGNQFSFNGPWVRWFGGFASGQIRASTYQTSPDEGPVRPLDSIPHLYGVENYDYSALFRIANQPTDPKQFPQPIGATFNVVAYNHTSGGPIEIDMLRVRQTVTPYPTVVVGAPEALPR